MGFKRNLGIGLASAVLGLGIIGGGTVAYFSDSTDANGKLTAGELDLTGGDVFYFNKMEPGETYDHEFTLENEGDVDINDLEVDIDAGADVDILKKDVKLTKVEAGDKTYHPNVSLNKLNGENHNFNDDAILGAINEDGLDVKMEFEFEETNKNQNDAMGKSAHFDLGVTGYSSGQ